MKSLPISRETLRTSGFAILFLTAWLCCWALAKWDAHWLYGLLAASVAAGVWLGRRRPVWMHLLLVLALVFPTWKQVRLYRDRTMSRGDAEVISALVTAEETILELTPKLGALSKGLLNLRLPV